MGGRRARLVHACDEDFEQMRLEPGGRHCARCDRTIVDLRSVTQRELDALAPARSICARVRVDADGVVITRDPALVPRRRAAAIAVAATLSACDPAPGPSVGVAAAQETAVAPEGAGSAASPRPLPPGPPMLPIERMPDGGVDAGVAACSSEAPPEADAEEVSPTAEQRALTRRKRRGLAVFRPPPHVHGGIVVFDD